MLRFTLPAKTTDVWNQMLCSEVPISIYSFWFSLLVLLLQNFFAPSVYEMIKVSQSCTAPNNKWIFIALKKCFDFKAASTDFSSEKKNPVKQLLQLKTFCFTKTSQILTKAIVKNNKQILGLSAENYLMIKDKFPRD